MEITANMVKELREKTGAGIMDCKKALAETKGDIVAAIEYLRRKGIAKASQKAGRAAQEGLVGAYIHQGGRIGVLVEVNCETDFVARTDDFQGLVKDIAMQIAASNPLYVSRGDVPEELIEKEKEVYRAQALESGKPEHVAERIVEGRMEKFFQEICLLEQPFIKDTNMTVEDLIKSYIAKLGENILVRRFARFEVGKED